jgi:fatty-acyl-CoA synthase
MQSHSLKPVGGKSHVVGDTSRPLLELTIPQLLARAVCANGPREAAVFVDQDKRFTWDEFAETVDQLAAGLLALGLETGERIGIWSPNRWEWLVTQFATARIGLILVNINPAYRLAELDYALNKVSCKALITAAKFKTSDYLGMLQTLAPELADAEPGDLRSKTLPHLRIVIRMGEDETPGMYNFADVLAMGRRG